MRLRRFLLSFGLANLCFNGVEYAVTAQSETRPTVLSAEDMMRILPGNTLLAYDKNGPFWMYFPEPGTVWGQSSDGDVDIGHWWIDGDQYCRSWRVWYGGTTQCWKLVSYGDNRLLWMDSLNSIQGESVVQRGNAIGTIRMPQLAAATVASEVDPVAESATIGPESRMRSSDPSADRIGSRSGSNARESAGGDPSGGSSGGASSGNDGSGGNSDNGASKGSSGGGSGGGSSSSGGSSGAASGGNSSGGSSSGGGSAGGNSSGGSSSGGGSSGGASSGGGSSAGGGGSSAGGASGGGSSGGASSGGSSAGGSAAGGDTGSSDGGSDQGGAVGGGDPGKGGKGHGKGKGGEGGQAGGKGGGGDKGGRGGDKGGKGKH
jgi:hypothetical protein